MQNQNKTKNKKTPPEQQRKEQPFLKKENRKPNTQENKDKTKDKNKQPQRQGDFALSVKSYDNITLNLFLELVE